MTTKRMELYIGQLGELLDEYESHFMKQVCLRKEAWGLDLEMERLDVKITYLGKKMRVLASSW